MHHTERYAQAVERIETLLPRLKACAAPAESDAGWRAIIELAGAARCIEKACQWLEQAEGLAHVE